MTLRQLEIFCAIVETGGFHAAAHKLHLAQPSVSQQIQTLEEELGQKLFLRSGNRRLQITEAGILFQENAERVLRICENARAEIAALASEPAGQVRIGMARHQLSGMLPPALVAFHDRFPNIRVELINGNSPQLLHHLRTDRLDLGLINLPIEDSDLETETLLTEEFVLVVPKESPLAGKRTVDVQAIDTLSIVTYGQSSSTRRRLDAYFREAGIAPRIAFEASSVETMKEMVTAGLGATILPASVVVEDARRRGLHYLSLKDRPLYRSVALVTALHQQFPLVVESLRGLIRHRMAEICDFLRRRGLAVSNGSSGIRRDQGPVAVKRPGSRRANAR